MSYDLFMKPRAGSVERAQFAEYFSARPNYKVEGDQAWYQNEDTGAYFVFEHSDGTVSNAPGGENAIGHPLSFNLNYFRPSFFGMEAEPEVRLFARTFDLLVEDPQVDGMGAGEYDREKFLSGWNSGNEFGYQAILKEHGPEKIHTLPSAEIERTWRWNYERKQRQSELGESCYASRIFFIEADGLVKSAALWPDAIASLLPEVDYLIVGRNELAPKGLFRRKPDHLLVKWKDAEALVVAHSTRSDRPGFRLNYESGPRPVVEFVRNLPTDGRKFVGIAADAVLNEELVAKFSA